MTSLKSPAALDFRTQYALPLSEQDEEINVDLFAGGGGASTGLEIGRAAFHGWGSQCDEFADGIGQSSVAIVEFEDGMVETYAPNQIHFLDRGPDAQA